MIENLLNETYLYNHVEKKETDFNVWMAYPGCYSFSMSSLGYLWIYKIIDDLEKVNVERICSDSEKTRIMLQDVDLFGFSFSFDLDFLNVFKMLEKYNIPIKSAQRTEDMPLVFGGGPVLTANPAPYSDFFDFIVIGDGEVSNIEAIKLCQRLKGHAKDDILKALSDIDGIYVPKYPKNIVKKSNCELEKCIYSPILCEKSFFKNTLIMEIARGCSNRCGFCVASYLNLPTRFVKYEQIIDIIEKGLPHTHKIALLGALISAHPDFERICEYIREKRKEIADLELSVSSLRADSINPEVIKTLVECGQKHVTIAIEAGSERLRKVINKHLTNEQIFETANIAQEKALKGLKIYAMIGLPTETKEDLKEMVKLAKELKSAHKCFDFTFSFSTFVPKPQTPFQWCSRDSIKNLERKQNYLKKEFHKMGVKARFSSAKWDYYQALLSRGNKLIGEYIYNVYKTGGNLGAFKGAYRDLEKAKKLPSSDYFALREIPIDEALPWNFIQINPNKEILQSEHDRLLKITRNIANGF